MSDKNTKIDEIWIDDVLERKTDAEFIQKYLVNRYSAKKSEPGFVLAINAEWGYGKSFMLKHWQEQMIFQNYPAVFFDAWANDFTSDPLLAFIAEFDSGLKEYFTHVPISTGIKDKALDAVKKMWKPALTVLACAAFKQLAGMSMAHPRELLEDSNHIDDENDDEVDQTSNDPEKNKVDFKSVRDQLENAITKALDKHQTTKSAISAFKKKLAVLIDELGKVSGVQLPMFIFVDELDRCRPDYAIELLEGIKHLFGVPGVYFVIATNLGQLSESIRAVYGAGFDGQRYLKRFFDLQYALPEPNNMQFANMLFKKMVVPELDNIIYGLESCDTRKIDFSKSL